MAITMDSRATKRWVLRVSLSCAVFGLVLKLADLHGRDETHRRAGESASAHRGEGAAPPARAVDRPRRLPPSPNDLPSGGEEPSSTGKTDDGTAAGSLSPMRQDATSRYQGATERHLTRLGYLRRHGRARDRADMPTSSENGSLAASGVGEEASDGLPSRPAGSSLRVPAGQTVAGSKQAGTADAREVDAAPARTDITFDSGDAQYQTAEQIEIPDFGKIAGPAGSISLWLQPGWQEGNQDDATLIELGDGRLQLSKNVTFLRFEFIDDGGNDGGVGAPIGEWQQGEWHQVTATWNGNQYALYLDGQPVSQTVHDGRVDLPPDARLYIGSNYPDSRPVASATIGRVDLRNRPLGPGEVASNYNAVAGRSVSARTGR